LTCVLAPQLSIEYGHKPEATLLRALERTARARNHGKVKECSQEEIQQAERMARQLLAEEAREEAAQRKVPHPHSPLSHALTSD
jgi:hypothetical protein